MVGGPSVALWRDIQTLFDGGTVGGMTDRQLLERFTQHRDASFEAAFEVLVRRPRADGAAGLPQRAEGLERCRGRVPGDLHRPGPALRVDPQAGLDRELALRRRLPGGGAGAGRGRAAACRRAPRRRGGRFGPRSAPGRRGRSTRDRAARPGGGPSAAREISRRGGALLLGGPDAGAGRGAARLPAGHRPQPAGQGQGLAASAIGPPRGGLAGRRGGPGLRLFVHRTDPGQRPRFLGGLGCQDGHERRGGHGSRHGGRRVGVRQRPGPFRAEEHVDDQGEDDRHLPVVHRPGGRRGDPGGAPGRQGPARSGRRPGPPPRPEGLPGDPVRQPPWAKGKSSPPCTSCRAT